MSRVSRWEVAYACDGCLKRLRVLVHVGDELLCARCCRKFGEELLASAKEAEEKEEAMR